MYTTAAAAAGAVAMAVAVKRGLLRDVSFGPAIASLSVAVLAGCGWAWLVRRRGPIVLALIALATVGGVWAAVADTEAAAALIAAWVPFAILAVLADGRAPKDSAHHQTHAASWFGLAVVALAVVAAWSAAWGASARTTTLPGALACFGVALVAPWAYRVRASLWSSTWLVVVHVAAVVAAARWATRASTVSSGVLRSAVVLAVLALVAGVSSLSSRQRERARRRPSGPPRRPR